MLFWDRDHDQFHHDHDDLHTHTEDHTMLPHLPGLPHAVFLHEAAHAAFCRFYGIPIACLWSFPTGEAGTFTSCGTSPDGLFQAAVMTAAGVTFDRMAGVPESRHAQDVADLEELAAKYREATGETMPDAIAEAERLWRTEPVLTRETLSIAWAMEWGKVYTAEQIAVMASETKEQREERARIEAAKAKEKNLGDACLAALATHGQPTPPVGAGAAAGAGPTYGRGVEGGSGMGGVRWW